jgi:hypothetical protein
MLQISYTHTHTLEDFPNTKLETKQCYYVDMILSLTMIKESPKEINVINLNDPPILVNCMKNKPFQI